MYKLKLSVSKTQIKTKTEGMPITDFLAKEFDITPTSDLKELFTTRLYSTNYWEGGKCGKRNYIGMYGIAVDVDNGITVDEAKELFKEYNYIIHTSTSHKADLPAKGGAKDRFRIILPFDPNMYTRYSDVNRAQALYAVIIKKYTFIDKSCAEPARKYFPYLNSAYPQLFELYINETGKYYEVPDAEIDTIYASLMSAKKTKKFSNYSNDLVDTGQKYITWDTEITLADKITTVKIRDIHEATHSVFCPFCDDINSNGTSAHIGFNQEHYPFLRCDHCKSVGEGHDGKYYLPLNEKLHNLFYLDDKIYWVRIGKKNISVGKMPMSYLNNLTSDDLKRFLRWLSINKSISSDEFKLQKVYDGYTEELTWKILEDGATLEMRLPPIAVKIQDNAYINEWIEATMGPHAEFFKDYLALFCYHNHEKMPVIILTGPRRSGKTTIAEFMSDLFFDCHADWTGADDDQFNSYFEKRLLIIDEATINKQEQYTKLKAITGRSDLRINKKHKAEYQVANNICVIMLTNAAVPMYLVDKECPVDAKDNQWFMYHLSGFGNALNSRKKTELIDRAGHYVRTELRDRYERFIASGLVKECRYSLPVPITGLLKQQFHNAKSALDYECDSVMLGCLKGIPVYDKLGNLLKNVGPFDIVNTEDLRRLIDAADVTNSNIKSFRERMQLRGYLRNEVIRKNELDAWEVDKEGMKRLQKLKGV
jgi:hypothetical protein